MFGVEYSEEDLLPRPKTLIEKALGKYNFRKSDDKERRCKTCLQFFYRNGNIKRYPKCSLVGCSASEATDIRVNHVCDVWEADREDAIPADAGCECVSSRSVPGDDNHDGRPSRFSLRENTVGSQDP